MEKTLANGAELDAATWDDFVRRLRHHCRGDGVNDHYTAAALFIVQRRAFTYGIDLEYDPERVVVCDDYEWLSPQAYWDEADSEDARANLDEKAAAEHGAKFMELDAEDQWSILGGLPDHRVIGRAEHWDFVGAHHTREGAEAFIKRKGHDYRDGLRVYVEAQPYAWEFEAIKAGILNGRIQFSAGAAPAAAQPNKE